MSEFVILIGLTFLSQPNRKCNKKYFWQLVKSFIILNIAIHTLITEQLISWGLLWMY